MLRTLSMCRAGASDRFVVYNSTNPVAGRAVYAVVNIRRGGFLSMYPGVFKYVPDARPYTGTNKNVVDSNDHRIIPPAPSGRVSSAMYPGAMFNEAQEGVRAGGAVDRVASRRPPRPPVSATAPSSRRSTRIASS